MTSKFADALSLSIIEVPSIAKLSAVAFVASVSKLILLLNQLTDDLNIACVAHIFQKTDLFLASNYRPLSLTSIPSKIMEHIVNSQIIKHCHLLQTISMQQSTRYQTIQILSGVFLYVSIPPRCQRRMNSYPFYIISVLDFQPQYVMYPHL